MATAAKEQFKITGKRQEQKKSKTPKSEPKSLNGIDKIDKRASELYRAEFKTIVGATTNAKKKRDKISQTINLHKEKRAQYREKREALDQSIKNLKSKFGELLSKGQGTDEIKRQIWDLDLEREGLQRLIQDIDEKILPDVTNELESANRELKQIVELEIYKVKELIQNRLDSTLNEVANEIFAFDNALRKLWPQLGITASNINLSLQYNRIIINEMLPPYFKK